MEQAARDLVAKTVKANPISPSILNLYPRVARRLRMSEIAKQVTNSKPNFKSPWIRSKNCSSHSGIPIFGTANKLGWRKVYFKRWLSAEKSDLKIRKKWRQIQNEFVSYF